MKTIIKPIFATLLLCGVSMLSACGNEGGPNKVPVKNYGPAPVLNEIQNELYTTNCANCHAIPQTLAPQIHDRPAWDTRWAKGYDVLLNNTINGFESMPAMGGCMGCTKADLEIFIQYLAGRSHIAAQ